MLGVRDLGGGRGHLGRLDVAPQHIMAPEVEELRGAVAHEAAEGHVEDGVELLERLLLGLGQEEEHEEEADDVPRRVPREGALRRPCLHERRPRERDDRVEEPGRRCGERHAEGPDV